jgi:hypothetical protein
MKKMLPVLFLLSMLSLTGCDTRSARDIVGHTYGAIDSSTEFMTIYFSKSGNATINYSRSNERFNTSHFTYEIVGDDVEIYYDLSDYWIDSVQGEMYLHMTYYPEQDELHFMHEVFTRID